jgi:hypothetical protein
LGDAIAAIDARLGIADVVDVSARIAKLSGQPRDDLAPLFRERTEACLASIAGAVSDAALLGAVVSGLQNSEMVRRIFPDDMSLWALAAQADASAIEPRIRAAIDGSNATPDALYAASPEQALFGTPSLIAPTGLEEPIVLARTGFAMLSRVVEREPGNATALEAVEALRTMHGFYPPGLVVGGPNSWDFRDSDRFYDKLAAILQDWDIARIETTLRRADAVPGSLLRGLDIAGVEVRGALQFLTDESGELIEGLAVACRFRASMMFGDRNRELVLFVRDRGMVLLARARRDPAEIVASTASARASDGTPPIEPARPAALNTATQMQPSAPSRPAVASTVEPRAPAGYAAPAGEVQCSGCRVVLATRDASYSPLTAALVCGSCLAEHRTNAQQQAARDQYAGGVVGLLRRTWALFPLLIAIGIVAAINLHAC